MKTRYGPGSGGLRFDTGEGDTGPALDLLNRRPGEPFLWVRGADDKAVEIDLTIEQIHDLREHCTYLLQEAGLERGWTVSVPT